MNRRPTKLGARAVAPGVQNWANGPPTIPMLPGSRVTYLAPANRHACNMPAGSHLGQPYDVGQPYDLGQGDSTSPTVGGTVQRLFWAAIAPFLANLGAIAGSYWIVNLWLKGKQYSTVRRHGREVPTEKLKSEDRRKVFLGVAAGVTAFNHFFLRDAAEKYGKNAADVSTAKVVVILGSCALGLYAALSTAGRVRAFYRGRKPPVLESEQEGSGSSGGSGRGSSIAKV